MRITLKTYDRGNLFVANLFYSKIILKLWNLSTSQEWGQMSIIREKLIEDLYLDSFFTCMGKYTNKILKQIPA